MKAHLIDANGRSETIALKYPTATVMRANKDGSPGMETFDFVGTGPVWADQMDDRLYVASGLSEDERGHALSRYIQSTIPKPLDILRFEGPTL